MIETCRLKNVIIFIQTILSFALSRKILLYIIQKQFSSCGATIWHTSRPILKDAHIILCSKWIMLVLTQFRRVLRSCIPLKTKKLKGCLINSNNIYVSILCSHTFTILSYEGFVIKR